MISLKKIDINKEPKIKVLVKGFVMPPWYNRRYEKIEIEKGITIKSESNSNCIKKWKKSYLDDIINTYQQGFIPKGTVLYHSSLYYPLWKPTRISNTIFFGVDVLISIWYALEMYEKQFMKFQLSKSQYNRLEPDDIKEYEMYRKLVENKIGFLYVFRTTKDLQLTMIPNISDHVFTSNICSTNCIHPQGSFHGHDMTKFTKLDLTTMSNVPLLCGELSTEIILSNFNDVEVVDTFMIDISELEKHKYDDVYMWNPIHSLRRLMKPESNCVIL